MVQYEHNSAERIAHHEVSMARIKQQALLAENQKLLGAMAELVRSYSSQQQSSMAGIENPIHFCAVSTLMMQKKMAAIDKRIQESRQYLKEVDEIILTLEERAKQDAIQAVTDLAFPPND